MVSTYLDDCIEQRRLARQLRAAGHLLYLPSEIGVAGQADELHLTTAAGLAAVLATHNQKHFVPLHDRWQSEGRSHAGVILVRQRDDTGLKVGALLRAARLLTPEAPANQLMYLQMFNTEAGARGVRGQLGSLTAAESDGIDEPAIPGVAGLRPFGFWKYAYTYTWR